MHFIWSPPNRMISKWLATTTTTTIFTSTSTYTSITTNSNTFSSTITSFWVLFHCLFFIVGLRKKYVTIFMKSFPMVGKDQDF